MHKVIHQLASKYLMCMPFY